jgi:hypothetical protein
MAVASRFGWLSYSSETARERPAQDSLPEGAGAKQILTYLNLRLFDQREARRRDAH